MARLGCICGAEMTNTMAPSKNRISIFTCAEVKNAIKYNPDIKLWDFYSGWDEKGQCNDSFQNRSEPVEYWYCTSCKMVYEVQAISCGKILRKYVPHEGEKIIIDNNMRELIVLKDEEMDLLLNFNPNMLLRDFVDGNREMKYYVSENADKVFIFDGKTNTGIYTLMT